MQQWPLCTATHLSGTCGGCSFSGWETGQRDSCHTLLQHLNTVDQQGNQAGPFENGKPTIVHTVDLWFSVILFSSVAIDDVLTLVRQ